MQRNAKDKNVHNNKIKEREGEGRGGEGRGRSVKKDIKGLKSELGQVWLQV